MRKGELMVIIYKALEQAMPSGTAENPLETWANFMDRFDAAGRRQIGAQLAEAGKSPHTGEARITE